MKVHDVNMSIVLCFSFQCVSTVKQKVFQVEFSCSKEVNKVGKRFHFFTSFSLILLSVYSRRARVTMLRLFFLLAFVFFLGSTVTPQKKSSNRVITKVNLPLFENL